MRYDVYLQENLVGTVEADNTGHALSVVAKKIQNKEFVIPNPNEQPNIKVIPSNDQP